MLAARGMRVSLGAQSFQAPLLAVLERRATPAVVEAAVTTLRAAGVANLSLDLIHGIPGQDRALLDADLDRLLALAPEHCSVYELEAKPGTRFTHAHGAELERQAELLEEHYERVIERLEGAGYDWYETANFCRSGLRVAAQPRLLAGPRLRRHRHRRGLDVGDERRVNAPRIAPYLEAIAAGAPAPARVEALTADVRRRERLMLGLRLAEGVERSDGRGGRRRRCAGAAGARTGSSAERER